MFLAPNFFGGGPPKFLDLHYKERPYCDHVAKFRGDRPTELGGCPANKKKHHGQNIRPPGTNVPGGLKMFVTLCIKIQTADGTFASSLASVVGEVTVNK